VRDEVDRRHVFVEVTDEMLDLLGGLSDDQLRAMIDVMTRGAELEGRQDSTTR
jgi:hypothetical protein